MTQSFIYNLKQILHNSVTFDNHCFKFYHTFAQFSSSCVTIFWTTSLFDNKFVQIFSTFYIKLVENISEVCSYTVNGNTEESSYFIVGKAL